MQETKTPPARPTISPHAVLTTPDLRAVRWTDGFWRDRFETTRNSLIPAMGELMQKEERHRFLGNFYVAAGKETGRHRGPKWDDGDFYKWLEGVAAVHAIAPSDELDCTMDGIISAIGDAQAADGYIHTPQLIDRRNGGSAERFADPMHFELYNMGHLMLAAVVHQRATGKQSLMNLAMKAADFIDREFANPTPARARHGICPAHLMGLIDLYRATGETRYRDLPQRLLNMRDLVTNGDDDNQDRIPFRQQRTAHGHAVRATYLYAGAADVLAETGDQSLRPTLDAVWEDFVTKKLYITGGCGALHDGASPDASPEQLGITRVHQAFGRNFQLPHSTAHNETCAAIGNLLWSWRMFLLSGEAKYAELVEHTMLNSVLAGTNLDGTKFFYTNSLRRVDPLPQVLRFPQTRAHTLGCYCCPPNVARTMAEAGQYAYAVSIDGVSVVMYGSNVFETTLPDGSLLKLRQETDYPWDGRITLTIEQAPSQAMKLSLRIPLWANNATLCINGQDAKTNLTPGQFAAIERTWTAGDVVELDLPMPVRLMSAHPYVEECLGQVAVQRGPIVYCLESADLPEGVRPIDVHLPVEARFEVRRDKTLANVVTLETAALAYPNTEPSCTLYQPLVASEAIEIPITLVPYFAWDNRDQGEMSVWIPLAR